MMMRNVLAGITLCATLLATVASPSAQTTVRIGAASSSEMAAPVYVAIDQGYFREAGLTAELVDFRGGAPAIQALVGGGIEVCICAVDHVVRLRSRRQDAVVAVELDTRHSYALVSRPGTSFSSLADLRGKKIGITSPSSLTDNTLRWALAKAGLNPDRDVEIVGAGGGASMKAAIDSGRVDAGMVINADLLHMQTLGNNGYRIVQDFRQIPYPALALLTRQAWFTQQPDVARGFVRAVLRGIRAIRADRAVALAGLRRQFPDYSDVEIDKLAADMQARLAPEGRVEEQGYETLLDMLLPAEPGLRRIPFSEISIPPVQD
ncbi:ABC transporter substrate-binding protein [Roseomonas chloroacetimidivorans]|jgi:NitT/TauT family transport system substrate-binding protein|uniref:ABC transporter substrate-binding protein n=1 Tax=Roseomonas chloroacetimidivorans TaxID=1766656 RepID=UPI003C72D3A6